MSRVQRLTIRQVSCSFAIHVMQCNVNCNVSNKDSLLTRKQTKTINCDK